MIKLLFLFFIYQKVSSHCEIEIYKDIVNQLFKQKKNNFSDQFIEKKQLTQIFINTFEYLYNSQNKILKLKFSFYDEVDQYFINGYFEIEQDKILAIHLTELKTDYEKNFLKFGESHQYMSKFFFYFTKDFLVSLSSLIASKDLKELKLYADCIINYNLEKVLNNKFNFELDYLAFFKNKFFQIYFLTINELHKLLMDSNDRPEYYIIKNKNIGSFNSYYIHFKFNQVKR